VSGVVFKYKGKMPDRSVDGNAVEAKAYLSSGASQDHSDISLVLEQLGAVTPEAIARFGTPPARRVHDRPRTGPALESRPSQDCQCELAGSRHHRRELSWDRSGSARDLGCALNGTSPWHRPSTFINTSCRISSGGKPMRAQAPSGGSRPRRGLSRPPSRSWTMPASMSRCCRYPRLEFTSVTINALGR
jgi:hypothetical protein